MMPELPWKDIIAMRNTIVHQYFNVDLTQVWDTVLNDLPVLESNVRRVLNTLPR